MTSTSEENQASVFELVEDIKSHASEITTRMFDKKKVNALPNMPFELDIAQGWSSKLLFSNPTRDMWMKKGRPGAVLPEHFHDQVSQISTIIYGGCDLILPHETISLEIGSSVTIQQGMPHEIRADHKEGCEMVVIYQPPLSINRKITD